MRLRGILQGERLGHPCRLTAVKDWAENHFDEVRGARERYDAETPGD
jgi:hypothetical protein